MACKVKISIATALISLFFAVGEINAQVNPDSMALWEKIDPIEMHKETSIDEINIPTQTGTYFKYYNKDKNEFVYVLTGDIIIRNNYNTLTDVLRDLPQFIVNQPGTATQGEQFYSAGINGNENYIIMINGIKMNSVFSDGFPIAGNLPIRQAQRIEMTFNPASAIYGSGAVLGVINIITPQTERPVYLRASLNGLSNYYNNLSLLVGGKFGKGKNTIRFDVLGNYQKYRDLDLMIDTQTASIYNYRYRFYPYQLNNNYKQLPPQSGPVENLSDLTAFNVYYKNNHLFFSIWNRKDQASNGLNPLSMYKDIANFFVSDAQWNLAYTNDAIRRKHHNFYQVQLSRYTIREGSSSKFIYPGVKQAAFDYLLENIKGNAPADSIPKIMGRNLNFMEGAYFDQVRFTKGYSFDLNIKLLKEFTFNNLSLRVGYISTSSFGSPVNRFGRNPGTSYAISTDSIVGGSAINDIGLANTYLFATSGLITGITYSKNKLNIEANNILQYKTRISLNKSGLFASYYFMPSVRIRYNTQGESIALSYNSGIDVFNPVRIENQYTFMRYGNDSMKIVRDFNNYAPLKKTQITLGTSNTYFFYSVTTGIPVTGFYDGNGHYSKTAAPSFNHYGSISDPNSKLTHYGVMVDLGSRNIIGPRSNRNEPDTFSKIKPSYFKLGFIFMLSAQRYQLPIVESERKTNFFTPANKLRISFSYVLRKELHMTLFYNVTSKVRPSFFYENLIPNKKTFDLMFSYHFNRQFSAQLRWNNLFNTRLVGSQATGTVDDLDVQAQRRNKLLITLNYALE